MFSIFFVYFFFFFVKEFGYTHSKHICYVQGTGRLRKEYTRRMFYGFREEDEEELDVEEAIRKLENIVCI